MTTRKTRHNQRHKRPTLVTPIIRLLPPPPPPPPIQPVHVLQCSPRNSGARAPSPPTSFCQVAVIVSGELGRKHHHAGHFTLSILRCHRERRPHNPCVWKIRRVGLRCFARQQTLVDRGQRRIGARDLCDVPPSQRCHLGATAGGGGIPACTTNAEDGGCQRGFDGKGGGRWR
jgi:hypothetical protein